MKGTGMTFYRNPLWNKLELALGVFMIVVSGISFAKGLSVGIFQLAIGAILIGLHFTFWKKPIITFSQDQFELKASPLSKRFVVPYADIINMERPRSTQAQLWVRDGDKKRKVQLPLPILTPDDRESLISHLQSRMEH